MASTQCRSRWRKREKSGAFISGGLVIALMLTGAAFGLAVFKILTGPALLAAIGIMALVQIAMQFRFFLHIDLSRSKREDLQLILFTGLLVLIIGQRQPLDHGQSRPADDGQAHQVLREMGEEERGKAPGACPERSAGAVGDEENGPGHGQRAGHGAIELAQNRDEARGHDVRAPS